MTADGIERDLSDEAWVIDLETLALAKSLKTDLIIIPETWRAKGMPGLEIYDDYRE